MKERKSILWGGGGQWAFPVQTGPSPDWSQSGLLLVSALPHYRGCLFGDSGDAIK